MEEFGSKIEIFSTHNILSQKFTAVHWKTTTCTEPDLIHNNTDSSHCPSSNSNSHMKIMAQPVQPFI